VALCTANLDIRLLNRKHMKGYVLSMNDGTIYYDSREINLSKSNPSLPDSCFFYAYTPYRTRSNVCTLRNDGASFRFMLLCKVNSLMLMYAMT